MPDAPGPFALSHAEKILLVGSCFTEHMGARLAGGKFRVLVNPNGIVYNPVSLAKNLRQLLWGTFASQSESPESALFEHGGLWHSWEHHGDFSHPDRRECLRQMEAARQRASTFLQETDVLMVTLGTAVVFSLRESGRVVANNHKAPATWLSQRRLGVAEIVEIWAALIQDLNILRPGLRLLFSVSPVRHLRNGMVENQRSKAALLLACAELCERFDGAHYFPAYELLLDDLRDYRFFSGDMLHPNEQAIEYIWEYFARTFFPTATQELLLEISAIARAAQHRPFWPESPEHAAFAGQQLTRVRKLSEEHPDLDFSSEIAWFQQYSI